MADFEANMIEHDLGKVESMLWASGDSGMFSRRVVEMLLDAARYHRNGHMTALSEQEALKQTIGQSSDEKDGAVQKQAEKIKALEYDLSKRNKLLKAIIESATALDEELAAVQVIDGEPAPWGDQQAELGKHITTAKELFEEPSDRDPMS